MKKAISLCVALSVTPAWAATQAEIDAAASQSDQEFGQQDQRSDVQRDALNPAEAPSGLDVQVEVPDLPLATGATCIELESLAISGAAAMDEWDLEVLEAPFIGECISPDLASAVLATVTNHYLGRGFVTSRAYFPNQDLSQGVLSVVVGEGKVESALALAQPGVDASEPSMAGAFETDVDLPLNIRDLEQAVDQMNAVPGNAVTLKIKPGSTPETSQVVFENAGAPAFKGRISIDNAGSESTGKNGVTLSLQRGDLIAPNDLWSINLRESLGPDMRSSNSLSLDVTIPSGYTTYSAGHSDGGFNTLLSFPLTGTELVSEGANNRTYVAAKRVVYRDQSSKHSVGLRLERSSVDSLIGGTLINVNSRALNSLLISSDHSMAIGGSVLTLKPEIAIGLSEVDNLPGGTNTPNENPQSEYLRYKLSADLAKPFTWKDQNLRWTSKLVAQHSSEPLYGSQQLVVGGAGSVRGSKFVSIVGDSGQYLQNTLTLYKAHNINSVDIKADYFAGYDTGRVTSRRTGVYEGNQSALVFGANWVFAPWRISLTHGQPLDISGELTRGDSFTTTALGFDF